MHIQASAEECAFCTRPATGRVTATWSIFDWDYYDVCGMHIIAAKERLQARRIDSATPAEITVQRWHS